MFANVNDNGNGHFSFTSSKQLKNKTFDLDVTMFEDIMTDAASSSTDAHNGATAANGTAGLITRGSKQSTILVNKNGQEYVQLVEKGLMGATFMYQILNTYLTDSKIGPQVDNTTIVDGKNYTDLEHHFDEAFGYFGAAPDFSGSSEGSEAPRYWAKYSNTVNPHIGSNDAIMTAFRTGRAAIVANDRDVLNAQVVILNAELEKVAAATAIHYINDALESSDQGDQFHVLSEAYCFAMALRYGNPDHRTLTTAEVDNILGNIGDNFWEATNRQTECCQRCAQHGIRTGPGERRFVS